MLKEKEKQKQTEILFLKENISNLNRDKEKMNS